MQSMKETAANVAASAKSGMEKAKATAQEKVEKMTAHDPLDKDMARQKKEERVDQAELNKRAAREHNAAAKHMGGGTHDYTATGTQDYLTGSQDTQQPEDSPLAAPRRAWWGPRTQGLAGFRCTIPAPGLATLRVNMALQTVTLDSS